MKLSDIVTEQQLDELDVAGGVAKGIGAVAKGAGALAGVPGGMASQYQAGKQAARDAIAGRKITPGISGTTPDNRYGSVSKTTTDQILKLVGEIDPSAVADVEAALNKNTPAPAAKSAVQSPTTSSPQPTNVASQPAASKQATSTPKPALATPQTPGQIRATKQATAGANAQAQMAANPAAPKATTATSSPTASTMNKPDASFNNQLAGGKQTVSTGSKFNPATMQNTPGTPVGSKIQGGVPATGTTPQKDVTPAAEPGAAAFGNMASQLGKGNDKNYQATLDKNIAAQKAVPTVNLAQDPNATPTGNRPQGGGKVAGQLSDNPRAVKKRDQRQAAADWNRMATGTESISYGVTESRSIFTK